MKILLIYLACTNSSTWSCTERQERIAVFDTKIACQEQLDKIRMYTDGGAYCTEEESYKRIKQLKELK